MVRREGSIGIGLLNGVMLCLPFWAAVISLMAR
ncbi:hypothetical protein PATA110616_14700 [Paenibacillus tarimensis]